MGFDIYGNRLRRGHCEVHPEIPESFPCHRCIEENREPDYVPEPLEPTTEDICGFEGHLYSGDDEDGGRCYCGAKRYPRGGPMKCVACGAPADERLCPDCRAEVDERARRFRDAAKRLEVPDK